MAPTVQDIHTFVNAINAGRAAVGLPVINHIEYDKCQPSSPKDCLSAHHLFNADPLVGHVCSDYVQISEPTDDTTDDVTSRLANALSTETECGEILIPASIKTVTDPFDMSHKGDEEWQELRALFVEAGYIED